jgi:CrcB protein
MTSLGEALLVAVGGGLGAVCRYLIGAALAARLGPTFPWGTFTVNVTGSFVAGLLVGLGDGRGLATGARLLAVTGFLGGYTTFSAFGVETLRLLEQQGAGLAAGNVIASVTLGLLAAGTGLAIGRAV